MIHYVDCYAGEEDMKSSDAKNGFNRDSVSIFTLLTSCGLMLLIVSIFIDILKEKRNLLNGFMSYFEKVLNNYNSKKEQKNIN